MMRPPLTTLALGILMGSAACARSTFQHHLEAARWTDAAEAFAADSALQRREAALFRAALLHSLPGTPVYNPARARDLLTQLRERFPRSRDRVAASHLQALLEAAEHTETMAQRELELRDRVARLTRQVDSLTAARQTLHHLLGAERERGRILRQTMDLLKEELRHRDQQIRALRTELDRLKAIDLRPPDRPAATTPPPGRR